MESLACDFFIEFLEVAFHNILFKAGIYPQEIFENRKKYGTPVKYSTHPNVNSYIKSCIKSVKEILTKGFLEKIAICFLSPDEIELQRYTFEVRDVACEMDSSDQYLIKYEQEFRGFCLKLANNNTFIKFPAGSTFSILIFTNESSTLNIMQNTDLENFPLVEINKNEKESKLSILPVNTFNVNGIVIEMYSEKTNKVA